MEDLLAAMNRLVLEEQSLGLVESFLIRLRAKRADGTCSFIGASVPLR
jgi:hypothetical protein